MKRAAILSAVAAAIGALPGCVPTGTRKSDNAPVATDRKAATFSTTPLHRAADHDRLAAAKRLLADGADPNAKDTDGSTPLHVAAGNDSQTVAELLLANGADPNARAKDGTTPLEVMPELAKIVKKLQAEKAKDKR